MPMNPPSGHPDQPLPDATRAATTERARQMLTHATWPPFLLDALARLREDGHAAYLVGGTVRDVLRGRSEPHVFDVATSRRPAEVESLFARVEPTGIRHGTVLIVLESGQIECTT